MQEDIIQTILSDFSRYDGKKKAVDTLFQYLYFHLRELGVYYVDEDARSDFLLWLYPRLYNIIAGYKPERSIFYTYLRMSISYNWKLFGRRTREQATYTAIAQDDQQQKVKDMLTERDDLHTYELYAASPPPSYSISSEKKQAIQETIKWKSKRKQIYVRYLLELVCKSCFYIDDRLLRIVARHLDIPVWKVKQLIEEAKEQTGKPDTVYNEWTAKRDFYYVRYKSATLQLQKVDTIHTSVVERLKNQQAYCYNLWQRYLKRIKDYTHGPSNRALAKQLGISRATVNNDLAELKKAWYGESCTFT